MITQLNSYSMGDNTTIPNLIDNVLVYGLDETFITYSGGNFLVKVGSLIEANGKFFRVESADVSIVASSGVLTFDSSTGTFSISASAYTWNSAKRGFYISANVRVCGWIVSSTGEYRRRNTSSLRKKETIYYSWSDGDTVDLVDLDNCMSVGDSRLCTGVMYLLRGAPIGSDYTMITSKITKLSNGNYNVYGWAYGRPNGFSPYEYVSATFSFSTGVQGQDVFGTNISTGAIAISC